MLWIKSIEIHNFGPFIDERIEFDDKPGISIIWGPNGSGKTTLVEVIKYALYGKCFEQSDKETSKTKTLNRQALREKDLEFHVTMSFNYDDMEYRLCRIQKIEKPVANPKDADFKESLTLERNGVTLSQAETNKILNQIMPEDISRFFMFDGEIISSYTRILSESNPDQEGRKIRETIEKILGLPALKNCAKDVETIMKFYENESCKVKTENLKQNEYQKALKGIIEEVNARKIELDQINSEIAKLDEELNSIQEKMRTVEGLDKVIQKKEFAESNKKKIEKDLEAEKELLKEINSNLWKSLIHDRCVEALESISDEHEELTHRASLDYIIKKSQTTGQCLICGRPFDENHNFAISISNKDKLRKTQLDRIKIILEPIAHAEPSYGQLKRTEERILGYEDELEQLKRDISECNDRLKSSKLDSEEVKCLNNQYAKLTKALSLKEDARDTSQAKLDELKKKQELAQSLLRESSTGELNVLSKKQDACKKILDVLDKSIDDYCQKLKQDIQRDATEIFQRIVQNGRFKGHELRLQDNYSLELLFSDGDGIPRRSAGYEKIIALSLLGGIHKNAPVEGPTFIDSPFSKLDEDNRKNIPDTLELMGDQVILLLYKGEIPEKDLKNSLKASLRKEYELKQENEYSTSIKEVC